MNTAVRWGIIAPGRIAHRFAQGFEKQEDGVLSAVASRDIERARSFASQYQIPHVCNNYLELITSADVDAIYIASPHRFHYETIKQCLEHGKAVLCEKPLTVTAKQSTELFKLAEETQTFLMEALWTRFLPIWQQIKQWINEGEIGEVQLLNSSFGFQPPRDDQDRLFNKALAGGVLLDAGVYCLSLSQFILEREPSKVHSAVLVGETGVDERCSVLMDYGNVTSQFTASFNTTLDNQFVISGSKGQIVVDGYFWGATKATLTRTGQPSKAIELPHRASGFEYQVDEVHRCLKQGKYLSDNMSATVTINTMKIIDSILAKAGITYPFLE
ncbi:Gfo/Idh/MocA family protein [Vibrio alginolyticus]